MKFKAWLASSLARQFPLGPIGSCRTAELLAARGEQVSFQACIRPDGTEPVEVSARAEAGPGLAVEVRRVGCVPVPHHNKATLPDDLDGLDRIPGFVPDVLYPESKALAAAGETCSFWITVRVSRSAAPGRRAVRVELSPAGGRPVRLGARVVVSPVTLPAQRRGFRMSHWFWADSLCDWYKVEPFDTAFWPICRRYFENYAAHGNDTIYVPAFTPPLNGVGRPTQLLGVRRTRRGRYVFDWSKVRRWIRLAKECGIGNLEWVHLFTQWGAAQAIPVYERRDGRDTLLWEPETPATAPVYRDFLAQYLPELKRFLHCERLMKRSLFHLSDEPHKDEHFANYRGARAMLRELAPWMRIMDALSDVRFAREGHIDLPVAVLNTAPEFAAEGIPGWCYFACDQRGRYLNRLMDTPLARIRMSGWLFRRMGAGGFLHWGYNHWHRLGIRELIDPFQVSDGGAWPTLPCGDTFVVYPGPDGPLDSIRWEVFAESMQDYALLEAAGVGPDAPLLAVIRGYDDFPKSENWIRAARRRLLT